MWRRALRTLALALLMSSTALAGPALAQEEDEVDDGVIQLEGLVIEGKIAKPQVFYVLGRSAVRYESLRLDQSFVHRIVESARRNPF